MRQVLLTLFVAAAVTPTVGLAAGQDLNGQAPGPQVTTLLKAGVAGAEGKEWNVLSVELAPGKADTRQFHPGVQLVYVLEGAGVLEVDGKRPVALSLGTVAALGPKEAHAIKNTSQTQVLKILVVQLLEKQQDRSVVTKRGAPPKAAEQRNSPRAELVF